jgi:trehalose utilization protein
MAIDRIHVTIWNEFVDERTDEQARAIYPEGIHAVIARAVAEQLHDGVTVRTATLDQPEHGLTAEVLEATDVLVWWAHDAHEQVVDDVVDRVQQRVLRGMGLVALHSSQGAKVLQRLLGTTCAVRWRVADEREVVWTVSPQHPVAAGVPHPFIIPQDEMYSEYFDIPQPDELVFISSFAGGEVFRSGCCFRRGWGRIFYFSPGHETNPVYYQPEVQRVVANAIRWAANTGGVQPTLYAPENSVMGWFES